MQRKNTSTHRWLKINGEWFKFKVCQKSKRFGLNVATINFAELEKQRKKRNEKK